MTKTAVKLGLQTKINPETGCWEWQGAKNKKGYGRLAQGLTHRLMYALWFKEEPGDRFVCHHCDNPGCINPTHLFLGTHQDNMEDAYQKGRIQRKLTPDDVRAIRSAKQGCVVLGRIYGINPKTVWEIRTRKIWKSVDPPSPNPAKP